MSMSRRGWFSASLGFSKFRGQLPFRTGQFESQMQQFCSINRRAIRLHLLLGAYHPLVEPRPFPIQNARPLPCEIHRIAYVVTILLHITFNPEWRGVGRTRNLRIGGGDACVRLISRLAEPMSASSFEGFDDYEPKKQPSQTSRGPR